MQLYPQPALDVRADLSIALRSVSDLSQLLTDAIIALTRASTAAHADQWHIARAELVDAADLFGSLAHRATRLGEDVCSYNVGSIDAHQVEDEHLTAA